MIPASVMNVLFTKIQTDTSVVLVRYDQSQNTYPYGTYRSSSCLVESAYRNVRSNAEKVGDPTIILQTRLEKYQDTYSFNFFDTQNLENARSAALNVFHWFGKEDNRSFCREQSVVPRIIATTVQDRSVLEDSSWKYQVGFDIRFDYTNEVGLEIEKLSTIKVAEEYASHNQNLEVEV
ncbi:hypothetical protein EHQ53_03160 [Leptospira langatensis]|uniref:Phage neck terminator protein gp12-like domain-containing protein n=1 Tax=Leptospira langatensis TaxID=2484983 RepID=A0A5F1ZXP5_9LEPT|nr:hypothetical protein [Leptospira langatensis]TGK04162.1 hypothetical protein EHO57_03390 [Leptospira langatensis]TGL43642.1 hypothetical protein EHQ53_03160 [Leptospira langatensis]